MGSQIVIQSIVVLFGLFISFCIGIHTGQESTDDEWITSAVNKEPLVKRGEIFTVSNVGGDE